MEPTGYPPTPLRRQWLLVCLILVLAAFVASVFCYVGTNIWIASATFFGIAALALVVRSGEKSRRQLEAEDQLLHNGSHPKDPTEVAPLTLRETNRQRSPLWLSVTLVAMWGTALIFFAGWLGLSDVDRWSKMGWRLLAASFFSFAVGGVYLVAWLLHARRKTSTELNSRYRR